MAADISPKDIKDKKILHPVPNNIKDSRKLDEFIKELLVEKKKLNQVKILEEIQDQVVNILAPLSKLQNSMLMERIATAQKFL